MSGEENQMVWEHELLWAKARHYIARALDEEPDSDRFPFEASLALEFLCRASLAYLNPVLLADTNPSDGRHIIYALGHTPRVKNYVPRAVAFSTVVERCELLVSGFTSSIGSFCRGFAERRNEELHTGGLPFADLGREQWQTRFYRACKVLLAHQDLDLASFIGEEEAQAAETMLATLADEEAKKIKRLVHSYKEVWTSKSEELQERLAEKAADAAKPYLGHVAPCPACQSKALITGEQIRQQPPKLEDDMLVERATVLPTAFRCEACGLQIDGHSQLQAAGLGTPFTSTYTSDPIEYYSELYAEVMGSGADYFNE